MWRSAADWKIRAPLRTTMNESFHEAQDGGHGKLAAGGGRELIGAVRAPRKFEELMSLAICTQLGEATTVADADE